MDYVCVVASNFFEFVVQIYRTRRCREAVSNDLQISAAVMSDLTAGLCLLKPSAMILI